MYFCATGWVENKCFVDKMVEVWPNVKKIMEFWKNLTKYNNRHVKATLKLVMLLLICLLRLKYPSVVFLFVNITYFTEIIITVIVVMMSVEHLIY